MRKKKLLRTVRCVYMCTFTIMLCCFKQLCKVLKLVKSQCINTKFCPLFLADEKDIRVLCTDGHHLPKAGFSTFFSDLRKRREGTTWKIKVKVVIVYISPYLKREANLLN